MALLKSVVSKFSDDPDTQDMISNLIVNIVFGTAGAWIFFIIANPLIWSIPKSLQFPVLITGAVLIIYTLHKYSTENVSEIFHRRTHLVTVGLGVIMMFVGLGFAKLIPGFEKPIMLFTTTGVQKSSPLPYALIGLAVLLYFYIKDIDKKTYKK